MVAPQEPRQLTLHLDPVRFVHLRLVGAIGRIEPDTTCIAAQIFERGLLIIDQRDYDFSVTRIVGAFDQREIAVPPSLWRKRRSIFSQRGR